MAGCGLMIINEENKVLLGNRSDGQGWSFCGGKLEENETLKECIIRETKEEFGLTVLEDNIFFIKGPFKCQVKRKGMHIEPSSYTFMTNSYTGTPNPADGEMLELKWFSSYELKGVQLFPPTYTGLEFWGFFNDTSPHGKLGILGHY